MTLDPLIRAYLAARVARGEIQPNTAYRHRYLLRALADVHGNRPLGQFGLATVDRWLAGTKNGAAGTTRIRISVVRGFAGWLVEERHIKRDPTRTLRPPRLPIRDPRALDADVVHKILLAAPDDRGRLILWLMVGMGLRCIEVSRLRIEHWSRTSNTMRITGKGGNERELPVTDEVRHAAESYLASYPAASGPLVRSYTHGGPVKSVTLSMLVHDWMVDAGVKRNAWDGISAHALRHTCASDVLEGLTGPDALLTVRDILGHRDISTTTIYLRRVNRTKLRAAMAGRHYDR